MRSEGVLLCKFCLGPALNRSVTGNVPGSSMLDPHGGRSGYLFETRNGTPLRLSNVLEDKLQPILKKLKLV